VMEKKDHFSNILMFMEKKDTFALIIVGIKLLNHQFLIEQLFFALNVKNNKVDPHNLPIYKILKICQIQNLPLDA